MLVWVGCMVVALLGCGQGPVVERVIDGDTLIVDGERVRLVGVDAPELGEPRAHVAHAMLTSWVLGEPVVLVSPFHADEDTDRYGRSLRYVEVEGVDVGLLLIEQDLARPAYDSVDGWEPHPREEQYREAQ